MKQFSRRGIIGALMAGSGLVALSACKNTANTNGTTTDSLDVTGLLALSTSVITGLQKLDADPEVVAVIGNSASQKISADLGKALDIQSKIAAAVGSTLSVTVGQGWVKTLLPLIEDGVSIALAFSSKLPSTAVAVLDAIQTIEPAISGIVSLVGAEAQIDRPRATMSVKQAQAIIAAA